MRGQVKHFLADKDIQIILATLLRIGVIISVSIIFIGAWIYLSEYGSMQADYKQFVPQRSEYSSIYMIFKQLASLDGKALIQLGILLLIFTPILRVAFAVFSFVIEGDYLYVGIGLLVLFIILFSLSNSFVH